MFISEIVSKPHFVEGRKFIDKTINSKFKKGEVSITTIYMDDKPIIKQYTLQGPNFLKHKWKNLNKPNKLDTLA